MPPARRLVVDAGLLPPVDEQRHNQPGGAQEGAEAQAAADAHSIVNDITLEVTVAHRGVLSAQARVELARPAVEQSRETLRLVRQRFRNGTATPTDVVDAETARTRSEQRYASASIEYLSALARLAYVMGDDPGGLCVPLTSPEDPAPARLPMPRPILLQEPKGG